MKIVAKLIFRECKKYINDKGENKIRVRFLDEDDNVVTLFYNDDDRHKKYLDMKKDTPCDVELNIYKSNKGSYALYSA